MVSASARVTATVQMQPFGIVRLHFVKCKKMNDKRRAHPNNNKFK